MHSYIELLHAILHLFPYSGKLNKKTTRQLSNRLRSRKLKATDFSADNKLLRWHIGLNQKMPKELEDHDQTIINMVDEIIENNLSEQEQDVLKRRFGIDREEETLREIAASYDANYSNILRVEAAAIEKLMDPNVSGHIKEFLVEVGLMQNTDSS